jgi:hypothetical protein
MDAKKILLTKRKQFVLGPSTALSTGSTMLNLACTDEPRYGFMKGGYYFFWGDTQSGKAQPLHSKILTPFGWKQIGSLQIGDPVCDPDGGIAYITGVYPQGKIQTWKIIFDDGSSTECSGDHLWDVQRGKDKKKGILRTYTTKELHQWINTNKSNRGWGIPIPIPVSFASESKLPLHPYILGYLLGNGHFGSRRICVAYSDVEIETKLSNMVPSNIKFPSAAKRGGQIMMERRGLPNPIIQAIKNLGLAGKKSPDKFIPEIYLRASIEHRWELLRGLMDSDGCAGLKGAAGYCTSSLQLANGIRELIQSLGGTVKTTHRDPFYIYKGQRKNGKRSFRLAINFLDKKKAFSLKRKKDRASSNGYINKIIKHIKLSGRQECQCISVSSKRNLYITDDYIVTHNTWLTLTCLAEAQLHPVFSKYEPHFINVEGGILMDIEHYFGKKVADRLIEHNLETIQEFYRLLYDLLVKQKKKIILILDSENALDNLAAKKKFKDNKALAEKGEKESGSYGDGKAKYHSENIRWVLSAIRKTESIAIFIGQSRDNVNAFGFADKKTKSGGRALSFYANLEMQSSVGKPIKKIIRDKPREVGTTVIVQVRKNRVTGKVGKARSAVIPIYHGHGIDDVGSIVDFLIEEKYFEEMEPDDKKRKQYKVPEIDLVGTRGTIIRFVEEQNALEVFQDMAGKVWKEIENECLLVNRKPRYA